MCEPAETLHLLLEHFGIANIEPIRADNDDCPAGQAPVTVLIEELAQRGGGYGLFTGCAAGDTAMAVVLEVCDA